MKKCTKCNQEKDLTEFHKSRSTKDGLQYCCKACLKLYREDPKNKQRQKAYRNNPIVKEKIRVKKKEYFADPKNKAKRNDRDKKRQQTDLQYRFTRRIGEATNYALRAENNYYSETVQCMTHEFQAHIEFQFTEDMNWENYGFGKGKWNIDHIIPKSAFDLTDPEQFKECSHYSNCQPMWMIENSSKGANLISTDKSSESLSGSLSEPETNIPHITLK